MPRRSCSWVLFLLLPACGGSSSEEIEPGSESGSGSEPDPSAEPPADPSADPPVDPPGDPASPGLSDEFDDPSTLDGWRQWAEVAGEEPRHSQLDIGQTNPGMLTLRPRAGGWFGGFEGPLLYRMVSGDFIVETWVSADKVGAPDSPPDEQFNSAGLLVRDPEHGEGRANWIMYNVGRQLGERVATEGKTTVDSDSTLELTDGPRRGRLRICRRGASFVLARQLEGETEFTVTQRYERGDLPADVQVGMIANGWNTSASQPDLSRTPDLEATFDYVRFSVPTSDADCTSA